jgi:hypothetical protein
MQSNIPTAAAFALSVAFAFGAPAMSADLPQAGSFTTHSAGKAIPQATQVGDKRFMVSGTTWQVIYNDAGSGPLHMGSMVCKWSLDDVTGSYNITGVCAFGDAGGADKIFIGFSGKGIDKVGEQGTGILTGGIGKYDGIQGKLAYQCKIIDPVEVVFNCNEQIDYQLKAASATR